jgi:hypothetical protein
MADDERAGCEQTIRKLRRFRLPVGARRHHDMIFAELVDADGGKPRGIGHRREGREIDAGIAQILQRRFGQRVATDAADHLDLGTGACGCQRLVAALATGSQLIAGAEYRFTG